MKSLSCQHVSHINHKQNSNLLMLSCLFFHSSPQSTNLFSWNYFNILQTFFHLMTIFLQFFKQWKEDLTLLSKILRKFIVSPNCYNFIIFVKIDEVNESLLRHYSFFSCFLFPFKHLTQFINHKFIQLSLRRFHGTPNQVL